jgi:hypothetical protein
MGGYVYRVSGRNVDNIFFPRNLISRHRNGFTGIDLSSLFVIFIVRLQIALRSVHSVTLIGRNALEASSVLMLSF